MMKRFAEWFGTAIVLTLATMALGAAMAQGPPPPYSGPGPCPTGIMGPSAGALTYDGTGCGAYSYDASASNYVEITTNATGSNGCFSRQSQIWREAGGAGCGINDTILVDTGVKQGTIACELDQTAPFTQTISTVGSAWACGTTCGCHYYNKFSVGWGSCSGLTISIDTTTPNNKCHP